MNDDPPAPDEALSGPEIDRSVREIRRSMLERIATASTPRHVTVRQSDDGWQPLLEGVQCKVLHEDPVQGSLSYLLLLAPGAALPAHRHPQDEECLVLDGELRIGDQLVVRAGDYHLGKAGVLHARIVSEPGALVFIRGAPPELEHVL